MNCYVYFDEKSKEGIIIDPGAYFPIEKSDIFGFISGDKIDVKYLVNTHGHIDHIIGNSWAKEQFPVPLLMHKDDMPLIEQAVDQATLFGIDICQPPVPDKFMNEGDVIKFADRELKVIHTPGHSPGSVVPVDEKAKVIFGGDVLFKGSVGRTDLWMGDMDTLLDSIFKKVIVLGDEYVVYPGHFEETTIGEERKNNPSLSM